jgi:ferredoxin
MYTLQNGFVNAGFIFFSLAILATLIFGRFVCGWGCHILALQDFCGWLLKKMGLHPKPFRSRLLVYVPLVAALYMFVWPVVYRMFWTRRPRTTHPEIHESSGDHKILGDVSFCRGGHPISVYLRLRHRLFFRAKRLLHLRVPVWGFLRSRRQILAGKNPGYACMQSVRAIAPATCTSNVLVHAEVKQYGMVVDPGCMKCMDCVSVCPNDALYFGFGKPTLLAPKSKRH